MQCPIDSTTLAITDRQGIEIDYCPKCRGVWLDRGELDKLIEKSEQYEENAPSKNRRRNRDDEYNDEEEGGFLGNIFGGFGRDND